MTAARAGAGEALLVASELGRHAPNDNVAVAARRTAAGPPTYRNNSSRGGGDREAKQAGKAHGSPLGGRAYNHLGEIVKIEA